MTSIYAGVTQGHSCMDREWHCRGCPKGSVLLHAGTLHSKGMGSRIVPMIASPGDVEPARCSGVHQRPHRRCSGLAGAGLAAGGSRWSSTAGTAGAGRRGQREQLDQQPEPCVLQRGTWKCCAVRGVGGGDGACLNMVQGPRGSLVCSGDRLTLLPARPPAPVPLCNELLVLSPASRAHTAGPSGLSNAHCSQGHPCRNHSSASPPQAHQHCSAWCSIRDGGRLFLFLMLQWRKERVLATGILNEANPRVHLPCKNTWRAAALGQGSEPWQAPVGCMAMAPFQGTHRCWGYSRSYGQWRAV